MPGEIIEGMLEVPPSFVVPKLEVVEQTAETAAMQYVALWESVLNDPRTERKKNRYYSEGSAVHSQQPDTTLFVKRRSYVYSGKPKRGRQMPKSFDNRIMTIIDPDGRMEIEVDLMAQPLANLANDPYAEFIMDCFRRHLAG